MSVVKKFQSGGSIGSYSDFISKKLNETKFTAKTAKEAEEVGNRWRELAKTGKLSEIYSYDPNKNSYTIDVTKLPDELKTFDWSGSQTPIKPNSFGQISSGSKRKGSSGVQNLNTLFSSWTNDFLKSNPTSQTTEETKKYSLGKLSDFIKDKYYGGSEDYLDLWNKDRSILGGAEDIKKNIMSKALEHINLYNKKYTERPSEFNQIENPEAIINAINSGDWNKFILESRKFGWSPDEFIEDSEQKNQLAQEEKQTLDREALVKDLASKGYSDTIINEILNRGFNKLSENNILKGFEKYPYLQEDINKNGLVLTDDYGRQVVINKFGYYNPIFKDPDAPDKSYGTYLEHREGVPVFYTPETEGYKKDLFNFEDNFVRRPIIGTAEGFEGWNIEAIPSGSKDVQQSLNRLVLTDPETGKEIEVLKSNDGYKRLDTGVPINIDIKEFGQTQGKYDLYGKILNLQKEGIDIFQNIKENKPTISNDQVLQEARTVSQINENSGFYQAAASVLPKLKYIINNDPSILKRNEAAVEYKRISDMVGKKEDYLTIIDNILKATPIKTSIQSPSMTAEQISAFTKNPRLAAYNMASKFQKGGTISKEEFFGRPQKIEEKVSTKSKPDDIRGTLADMSTLQKVSLAGAATSFIPGFGAIGAAVSTGADLADDLKDGKIDNWGTHAMNLGFTALSALGFGALKSLQSTSKLAKLGEKVLPVLDKFEDVKVVNVLKNAGSKIQSAGKISNFKNAGIVAEELEALKQVGLVSKKANLTTTIKKGLAEEVIPYISNKTSKLEILSKRPSFLEREFSGTVNLVKNAIPYGSKALGIGFKGAGLLGVGASTLSAAKDISEGGIGNIKYTDAKNIAYGIGATRGLLKQRQAAKTAKSLLTEAQESKQKIQFGNQEPIELNSKINLPELSKVKRYKMFSEKANKEIQEKNDPILNKFKEELRKAIGNDEVIPENLDNLLKSGKVKLIAPEKTSIKSLGQSGLSKEDYERSKAILEGKITSYFMPNWIKNNYFKKGGIIKYQNGGYNLPITNFSFGQKNSIIPGKFDVSSRMYGNVPETDTQVAVKKFLPRDLGLNEQLLESVEKSKSDWTRNPSSLIALRVGDKHYLRSGENMGQRLGNRFLYKNEISPVVDKNLVPMKQLVSGSSEVLEGKNIFNIKPPIEDLLNVGMYAFTKNANEKIASSQKQAAMAGITKMPLINRQYFRTSSPYAHFYENQATKIGNIGERISSSISDLDKGILTRLSAASQANELREKGMQSDQQAIQNIMNQQMESDRQTDTTNLGIIGRNLQSVSEAEKQLHLIDSNKFLANNTAINNLLLNLNRNKEIRSYKNRAKELFDLSTNSKNSELYDNLRNLSAEEEKAKLNYEKSNELGTVKVPWEQTAESKDFKNRALDIKKILEESSQKISNAKLALSLGLTPGSYAKGGTLAEKSI